MAGESTTTTSAPAAPPQGGAPKPGAPAAASPGKPGAPATPPSTESKHKIKVNGQEREHTLSEIIALAQKGAFADQRLKSADVVTKNTQTLIAKLKTPEGVLEVLKDPSLGNSPKEVLRKLLASDLIDDELKEDIAKWTYENVVARAKKSPEELERDEKLKDYERLRKQEDDRKKADLTTKQNAQVNEMYQAIRGEVSKQISADKTFPKTEGTIRAVIDTLRGMNKKGAGVTSENITKALEKVKKDHVLHQQSLLDSATDDEHLISLIGEARALRISKALVARLRNKGKVKADAPKPEEKTEESLEERNKKKFNRDRHGYAVMDVM